MLMRAVTTSLLVLVAAPAWAMDYCKATTLRGDREAIAEAFVDGDKLTSIRIEDILIPGTVTMDPAAKDYTVSVNGAAGLTPYRTGQSVEGKNWQERGSVATLFGGMTLHWPQFYYKDGKSIASVLIRFNVEGLQQGVTTMDTGSPDDRQNLHVGWDLRWITLPPHNYRSQSVYSQREIEFWPNVAVPGKSMRVEFFDGVASRPLGSVSFAWPAEAPWNTRMAEQVNMLRELHAAKKCSVAATLKGDDDDFEEWEDEEL